MVLDSSAISSEQVAIVLVRVIIAVIKHYDCEHLREKGLISAYMSPFLVLIQARQSRNSSEEPGARN